MTKARYFGSCVYVAPGFIVRLGSRNHSASEWMTAELYEVLDITYRYGAINGGMTRQRPVLDLRGLETGVIRYCDNGFVEEVVERKTPLRGLPENYFRREPVLLALIEKDGGVWRGDLTAMMTAILATLPLNLPRKLNREKALQLYLKHRVGLIDIFKGQLSGVKATVRIKPFRRWVEQNAFRLMVTVKELSEKETQDNLEWERAYEEELEMDMEEDARKEEAVIPSYPREG